MGYGEGMDIRRASPAPQPDPGGDWVEEPLTAADIAACEEAEAQIARGEWVDGEVGMAMLDQLIADLEAKCRR